MRKCESPTCITCGNASETRKKAEAVRKAKEEVVEAARLLAKHPASPCAVMNVRLSVEALEEVER